MSATIAPSRPHEEVMIELLRDDPAFAAEYLGTVLEDGDQQEIASVLRRLYQAYGLVWEVAELDAPAFYKLLSPQGNPELKSLIAQLKAMKMRLAIQPIPIPVKVEALAA